MITCQLSGGLGNQLFQVFATLAYSIRYNISVMFEYKNETTEYRTPEGIQMRDTYWNTFFVHIIGLTTYSLERNSGIDVSSFFPYKEPRFEYNKLPPEISTRNMKLVGYFQSPLYFQDKEEYIFKLLKIQKLKEMIKKIYDFSEECVSLHFRIGDYQYLDEHPVLPLEYYKKSLRYIFQKRENRNVLVFSQKEDEILVDLQLSILRREFPEATFTKVDEHVSDWEQLLIMSCCRDNIIANSTFSWWGAYLNRGDKIVCYPKKWFNSSKNTSNMFPEDWVMVNEH
jgi:hypothetical protein